MSYSTKAKKAGQRLELNWWVRNKSTGNGVWRKKVKGKMLYFNYPDTKEGYRGALLDFAQKQADRPHADVWKHHINLFSQVKTFYDQFGTDDDERDVAQQVSECVEWLQGMLDSGQELSRSIPFGGFTYRKRDAFYTEFIGKRPSDDWLLPPEDGYTAIGTIQYRLPAKWQDRLKRLRKASHTKRLPQTVRFWADRLIAFKEKQAGADQAAARTPASAKQKLNLFLSFVGEDAHVKTLTGSKWEEFYFHLIEKKYAESTATGYRNAAKELIKMCWRNDECQLDVLPKNLDDPMLRIVASGNDDEPKDYIWTREEFEAALKHLSDKWKCFLLLMLNCGYTQADLEELKHHHYKNGRIVRKRTKTKRKNPPVVSYKLWQRTIDAIERVKEQEGDHLLTTERGARISTPVYDNLTRDWMRKRQTIEQLPNKELKGLRKTGATTIKQHPHLGWIRKLYLGQVGDVTDKHYDAKDGRAYQPLDDAIKYLGEQFGVS